MCLVERDDAGCIDHEKTSQSDSSPQKTCFDDNGGLKIHTRNCTLHHPNASGRKRLLQHGQGDNNVHILGEAPRHLQKAIVLVKLILIRQLFNMKMKETDLTTSHINTFSRVLSKLSSQGINFEEEVKALALLLSLRVTWEVFGTTFANNCPKLNLDKTICQVLTEDIRQKSMGITIDDSAEAHNSTESIDRFNCSRKQAKRTGRNSSRPRHRED